MKTKNPTIDAQEIKKKLMAMAKKIGKRKRLNAAQFFQIATDIHNT